MASLELVRAQIRRLYQSNPEIHLDVSLKNPKIILENTTATITGVYSHIFQIEESTSGRPQQHILQYADVLTHSIVIHELEKGRDA